MEKMQSGGLFLGLLEQQVLQAQEVVELPGRRQ
jgi:hypothetical protein